jgi:hypothetical protein
MITLRDYVRSLVLLVTDRRTRDGLSEIRKRVRISVLPKRFNILRCEELRGDQIKDEYRFPENIPLHIKNLDDKSRFVVIHFLAKSRDSISGYVSVDGILDLGGEALFIDCQPAFIPNLPYS